MIIEGVPSNIVLDLEELSQWIHRRKVGDLVELTSIATTQRKEDDTPIFIEGVVPYSESIESAKEILPQNSTEKFAEKSALTSIFTDNICKRVSYITTGERIVIEFKNENIRGKDYEDFDQVPRPSHADYVNKIKYNCNEDFLMGGGISSGRMTLPLVAAGYIATQIINAQRVTNIQQDISTQQDINTKQVTNTKQNSNSEDSISKQNQNRGIISINSYIKSIYGEEISSLWNQIIKDCAEEKDSVGGVIECKVDGLPAGIGEPFFDSLESIISHLAFSVPGIKGIEFGNGFKATELRGSENNDPIIDQTGKTKSNNSGGINGGISNGNPLIFRVAVKPTASIGKIQQTFNFKSQKVEPFSIKGRHDVCFGLRVPIVIEAITAIAIAELI